MDRSEGNDDLVSKGPCEKCGSSDGRATYADGHEFCFVCRDRTKPTQGGAPAPARKPKMAIADGGNAHSKNPERTREGLRERKITGKTLGRWGYYIATGRRQEVDVAPYFGENGELAYEKVRTPDKRFFLVPQGEDVPDINSCRPFGWHVFGDRFDRRVVVTEGEIDAMSVDQVEDGKFATVSIPGGAPAALKHMKANYLWFDRFAEIVLWFDDDEPGKKAMEECAGLFKIGKVRIAKAPPGFKDANDLLKAGRPGDITTSIYAATTWRPPGIVNAKDTPSDVCKPQEEDTAFRFNWHRDYLTSFLGPILPAQVVYHVAGTGIGKSTDLAELVYSLVGQGAKVGLMCFEDTRRDIKFRLLTMHTSRRIDIEDVREGIPDEQMLRWHEEVFGKGSIELFDPETAEWSMEAILGYVRYLAKALGCQVIVVDPLSFVAAGIDAKADERRALDTVSKEFAQASKELGINLQISHHLSRPEGTPHEEGAPTSLNQVRGSGGIANFANIVIGHERNTQAEGDASLITQHRALKNRPRSRTGIMGRAKYDLDSGRLADTHEDFPGPTTKGGRGARGEGFGPAPGAQQDY